MDAVDNRESDCPRAELMYACSVFLDESIQEARFLVFIDLLVWILALWSLQTDESNSCQIMERK